jgi:isopenicillin N synthase-like dioxygenase
MAVGTGTTKLELRTAYGPVFRDVLDSPPRDCLPEEIPIIDLSALHSNSPTDRRALANEIRIACTNTGFFYIKNHGISDEIIENAKQQLLLFFKQSEEDKLRVSTKQSKFFNGYKGPRSTNISPGESVDVKESVTPYRMTNIKKFADQNIVRMEIRPTVRPRH